MKLSISPLKSIIALGVFIPLQGFAMAKWVDERVWHCPGDEIEIINCDVRALRSELHPIKLIQCLKGNQEKYFLLNFEYKDQTVTVSKINADSMGAIYYFYNNTLFTFFKNINGKYVLFHLERSFGVLNKTSSEYACQLHFHR